MASSEAILSLATPDDVVHLPPQHENIYPTFADLAQRLGYLQFARDLDITNANNQSILPINETVAVNAWIYKLCMAYKEWDGTWFQAGAKISNTEHRKRILKDAILQVSQSVSANHKLVLTTPSSVVISPWTLIGTGSSNLLQLADNTFAVR